VSAAYCPIIVIAVTTHTSSTAAVPVFGRDRVTAGRVAVAPASWADVAAAASVARAMSSAARRAADVVRRSLDRSAHHTTAAPTNVSAATSPKTARQPMAWPRAVEAGTPRMSAIVPPPSTMDTARPICASGTRRAA
jgi:hypothetical protein